MTKLMLLSKTDDCIVAKHFHKGEPDPEIVDLFGTHILPTSFVSSLKLARETLTKLNPDYLVMSEG